LRIVGLRADPKNFMDTERIETMEARKLKDAILKEIFEAYREAGALYKKTADPETRLAVLDMKRGFDLAIQHLLPVDARYEKLWEELKALFSN